MKQSGNDSLRASGIIDRSGRDRSPRGLGRRRRDAGLPTAGARGSGRRKWSLCSSHFGLFIVIAILGPLLGADIRFPGGDPTEPGGKIWPGPR